MAESRKDVSFLVFRNGYAFVQAIDQRGRHSMANERNMIYKQIIFLFSFYLASASVFSGGGKGIAFSEIGTACFFAFLTVFGDKGDLLVPLIFS